MVVCPNPTGSTGYGMALQDGITGDWGGRPYRDLEAVWEWVVGDGGLPEVDGGRAVALGASYGGFMISEYFVVIVFFPASILFLFFFFPGFLLWF